MTPERVPSLRLRNTCGTHLGRETIFLGAVMPRFGSELAQYDHAPPWRGLARPIGVPSRACGGAVVHAENGANDFRLEGGVRPY